MAGPGRVWCERRGGRAHKELHGVVVVDKVLEGGLDVGLALDVVEGEVRRGRTLPLLPFSASASSSLSALSARRPSRPRGLLKPSSTLGRTGLPLTQT